MSDREASIQKLKAFRPLPDDGTGLLVKFRVFLPDHPGSLAGFASVIARNGGNIGFFHYDRAIDSTRVAVEVQVPSEEHLMRLSQALFADHYVVTEDRTARDDVQVTSLDSILELKVRLEDRPGTLAAFADLLAAHEANVIYMLYDEDIDAGSANIAMATGSAGEIDVLLKAMNESAYHYRVIYRGADEETVSRAIGLKLVEKFFLRLKRILPESDLEEVRSLVRSSSELEQDLMAFTAEAGNNLEAGDVFEKVLTFASRSRSWTGERFRPRIMPTLSFEGVELIGLRMPTSENIYLLRHDGVMTMIDAGHGIYYEDLVRYLRARSLDPATITRIFVTHPDTDHAGMSGYFEKDFGSQVFLHRGSDDVIRNRNRAWGASGSLLNLNKYYTRLSSRFTECRFPEHPQWLQTASDETVGGFPLIGRFRTGPLEFLVLESKGGHTPGLVFFLNKEHGLLVTSDFLINIGSLQPDEKEHLGIYRYLLTNPNRDMKIYKEETAALKDLILATDAELAQQGRGALILPGHGMYYLARELGKA